MSAGVLLDMMMGTGKSKVVIDLIQSVPALQRGAILLVCPKSVVPVWPMQIARHARYPDLWRVVEMDGGSVDERANKARGNYGLWECADKPGPLLIICNYEAVWRTGMGKFVEKIKWDLVVADEAQKTCAPGSTVSRFFHRALGSAPRRLALSGTPMPNTPVNAYGLFRWLDPAVFGTSFAIFKKQYFYQHPRIEQATAINPRTGNYFLSPAAEAEFTARYRSITFHAGEEVLELPPLTEVERYCTLAGEQARVYSELDSELIAEVRRGFVTAANAMVCTTRLQQATSGFGVLGITDEAMMQNWVEAGLASENEILDRGRVVEVGRAKQALLAEEFGEIGPSESVVVFCRFRHDLDVIKEEAAKAGRSCGEISGRAHDVKAMWENDSPFDTLAVQLQSGGLGIDLTRARYVIYFNNWARSDFAQSLRRAHRPGQTRPVTVVHLLARSTVDEIILASIRQKTDILKAIVEAYQEKAA